MIVSINDVIHNSFIGAISKPEIVVKKSLRIVSIFSLLPA